MGKPAREFHGGERTRERGMLPKRESAEIQVETASGRRRPADRRRDGGDPELSESLDGRPPRGRPLAGEAQDPFLVREVDEDGNFPADAVDVRLQHGQGETHRHPGIHRVPALLEMWSPILLAR